MSAPDLDAAQQERLLDWYRRCRRDLPWRADRDAYRVWISEAMLQQTRVEAVREHFARFLERFPDVAALAAAAEEDVLAAWSGLGYYSRARKLREAARAIVADHGGRFPADVESARALPGVGPYTAGAVLSIAYDRPQALVDGNVERVLCRLLGLEGDPKRAPLKAELWRLAARLVARVASPGEWNQALMELGALVCTPRAAACERCPLAATCVARRQARVEELPRRAARRAAVPVELTLLAIEREGRLLLHRRPPGGRMAGLLELPTFERADGRGARTGLFAAGWPPAPLAAAVGAVTVGAELGELRHSITHHRIRAVVRRARIEGTARHPALAWLEEDARADAELTGMARKALAKGLLGRASRAEPRFGA